MEIVLLAVGTNDLAEFKEEMQRAFQKGYENTYGETEQVVLPEQDIDSSLDTEGAVAYKAVIGSEMVGGVVVIIDNKTKHNDCPHNRRQRQLPTRINHRVVQDKSSGRQTPY